MSREELALETQLLLQQVTQVTQQEAVESVLEDAAAPPEASEFESAKQALLVKLRSKKEARRKQRQHVNEKHYGPVGGAASADGSAMGAKPSSRQSKAATLRLPVASSCAAPSRKKREMLAKLRSQAIQQGSQSMAKLFGYDSYEAQLRYLNEMEKNLIKEDEVKDKRGQQQQREQAQLETKMQDAEQEADEERAQEAEAAASASADEPQAPSESTDIIMETLPEVEHVNEDVGAEETPSSATVSFDQSLGPLVDASVAVEASIPDATDPDTAVNSTAEPEDGDESGGEVAVKKRRHGISAPEKQEQVDGNEADSEQDEHEEQEGGKDKAAGYRSLLRAEAEATRARKRLVKRRGEQFVESEAEEEDEEDVLRLGGLGDFGFGVPQAQTQEAKEAVEERKALQLREDDLEHIVDELSDDEREQQQDLEYVFRQEQEAQDRQQVHEVMRNVKEGFGRNRRAFSGLHSGSEARGRFNLDELVAADGSKFEAARLGLLESDEDMSEDEDGEKKKKNGEEEEVEEEEEEDEEAEMERMLRLRFQDQPKIYVTSSESGSDDEDEQVAAKDGADDDVASDEERERQQIKLFSERARVNRRMQRMKEAQRQVALENRDADPKAKANAAVRPNVLLEEDEDSQELLKLLHRTDSSTAAPPDASHDGNKRFGSYGMASASRGSASFSRVLGNCKLFSANSSGSAAKGFVFTSLSSDKAESKGDEDAVIDTEDSATRSASKSHSAKAQGRKRRAAAAALGGKKPKRASGFLSVLSSFQRVSSTTSSAPPT